MTFSRAFSFTKHTSAKVTLYISLQSRIRAPFPSSMNDLGPLIPPLNVASVISMGLV